MKHKLFVKNALILTGTSFLLRGIGIFFRIYMAARIGAEGMGLYQLVFSLYVLAAAAGSGLPAAVMSRLASMPDDRGRVKPLLFASVLAALALFASGAVFFCSADRLAVSLLSDSRTALAIKILCFSLPFMGVSACIRGYFIAEKNTAIPSAAQLFEQVVRIALIAFLLTRFAGQGIEAALAAVLLGDSVAEAASFLFYLVALFANLRKKRGAVAKTPLAGKGMLAASLPITGSRYLSTFLRSAENLIIPTCLAAYSASSQAGVAQFGMLKGMALPLLFFPASFLGALSTLLLPEVSSTYAAGNLRKVRLYAGGAVGITLLASIPIMGVFWIFGQPLSNLVYQTEGVGTIVVTLAPIIPFMYLESVCDGILKGLTQQAHSLLYNVIDSVIRIAAIFLLVPHLGMPSFLGIMIFSNMLTSTLNIRRLLHVSKFRLPIGQFILVPLCVTALACLLGKMLYTILGHSTMALVLAIGVIAAVYVFSMWRYYKPRGGLSDCGEAAQRNPA